MHEVKAALQTNNWDLDAALKELQRQGLTAASKKVLIWELFLARVSC
jgi:translation elongation factor EF-Ts